VMSDLTLPDLLPRVARISVMRLDEAGFQCRKPPWVHTVSLASGKSIIENAVFSTWAAASSWLPEISPGVS